MTLTFEICFQWRPRGPVHLLYAGDLKVGGVQERDGHQSWFAWMVEDYGHSTVGYHPTLEAAQTALLDGVIDALTMGDGR